MQLRHTLYLDNNEPICLNPDRLGKEFVIYTGDSTAPPCKQCTALLFAHNEKMYKEEEQFAFEHNQRLIHNTQHGLAPSVGLLESPYFWLGFWVTLALIVLGTVLVIR